MDHLRSLYKATNPISPKKCKRKQAHENRANKRSELYTSTRNISPSPSASNHLCSTKEDQKENFKAPNALEAEKLQESEILRSPNTCKLSRQKAHILKFLAWKAQKAKQAQINEKSKRPPFVVSTRNCATSEHEVSNNIKKTSFAPANHIFRPPVTLQNLELKVIDSNSVRLINGAREETYHFLATPKKMSKKVESRDSPIKSFKKPMPISRAVIAKPIFDKTPVANIRVTKMQLNSKTKLETAVNVKEFPPKNKINPLPLKPKPVLPPIKQTTFRATKLKMPLNPKPVLETAGNVQELPPKQKANPCLLKPKPVLPPIKRATFKAPKKSNSSLSNAFLAVTGNTNPRGEVQRVKFNAKSVLSTLALSGKHVGQIHKTQTDTNQKFPLNNVVLSTKIKPKIKINGKLVQKTQADAGKPSEQIPETPTDGNQGYPCLNVVTSTKRKSLFSKESSANSLFVEMDQLVSPVDDATAVNGEKFNFLRYSVVESDANKPEDLKSKVADDVQVTPDKAALSHTPTTYLSPYVSVSRGKVGIKIEREKRNSIYMSVDKSVKEDADTTAKVRHTMATVHYYRKQLKDEITRLDGQCEAWQQYKESNAHLVEDNGSDMINVTIGQTKLLTTKKLKQFGDLIDRCEDGAMGKKSLGKGDGAKPILAEDLEGFWSMVGLQIENVDKRFANLQRWKENNWKDPDEVTAKSTKTKSNMKKMKKTKPGSTVGPNRDLQKLLRNAQAAFLRKKTTCGLDEDVILTPSKSRQVLIRDRRSRSAAATVITVNTPKLSRKSSAIEQTTPTGIIDDTKVLPHIQSFRKSMKLFKSAILNDLEEKSTGPNNCAIPIPTTRKSILKTPGSIRRPKSVIFNSPTLQFTVEDKVEDESPPQSISPSKMNKKEEEERTYKLRTRNIKLRDLADIIIPE